LQINYVLNYQFTVNLDSKAAKRC